MIGLTWLLAGAAHAEEPTPDVEEAPHEAVEDVPSALDGLMTSEEPGRRLVTFDAEAPRSTASWILWPTTGNSWFNENDQRYRSLYLGGFVGRRWYRLGGPGYLIEAGASALFPLGPKTRGRQLRASVLGGPRGEVASLQLGPVLAENVLELDGVGRLDDAAFVGGRAVLFLDVGPLTLHAGAEPVFAISGQRPRVDWEDTDWPGFGDELTWLAGVTVPLFASWHLLLADRLWVNALGAYHQPSLTLTLM